jgi:transposase
MLADFYGKLLIEPTTVALNRPELDQALHQLRQAVERHQLRDLIVAIERTGRHHQLPQRAFAAAGYEVRIVHPFATQQFRQPSDPGIKTDDTDLAGIHRAAANGFALTEQPLDSFWQELRLLERQRRDLVYKSSTLCTQIREHLEAAWPGYAACWDELWDRPAGLTLLTAFATPAALRAAGPSGLRDTLRAQGVRCQQPTLQRILDWAQHVASDHPVAALHRRIALDLNADRVRKTLEIQALERTLAARLVQTPYVLLLSFPGINVVSAVEFAGEMGPIQHYASARNITGRAGLYPSRYQSDQVDRPNGPLVRRCNRRLRAVILLIADNLVGSNHHFGVLAQRWKAAGKDARHTRVKIGLRFCRIAWQIVAGRQVFRHPCLQERSYVLDKLTAFQRDHDIPMAQALADLEAAVAQLPQTAHADEARPLAEELARIQHRHRRGPQLLGNILPLVLARLGVTVVQSGTSGE